MNSLHPRVDLRRILAGALFAARRRGPVTVSAAAAAVGRRGRYGRGGRRGRLRDGPLGGRRGTGHRAAGRPDGLHDDGGRRGPGAGRRGRGRGQVLRRADAVRRGRRRGGHLVLALDDAAAGRGRHADHVVVERRRYGRYGAAAAGRGQTADAAAAAVVLQVLQVGARGRGGSGRLQPLVLLVLLVLLLVIDRVQLRVVDHGRRRLLHVLRRVLLRRVTAGRGPGVVHAAAAAAAAALGRLSVVVGGRGGRGAARAVARLQRVHRRRDGPALLLLGLLALLVAVHELIRTHVHLSGSGRARALRRWHGSLRDGLPVRRRRSERPLSARLWRVQSSPAEGRRTLFFIRYLCIGFTSFGSGVSTGNNNVR